MELLAVIYKIQIIYTRPNTYYSSSIWFTELRSYQGTEQIWT